MNAFIVGKTSRTLKLMNITKSGFGSRGNQEVRIETLFSQLCDQCMLKRNYAKSTFGLSTRIISIIFRTISICANPE